MELECKKLLQKFGLKGYLVTEGKLIPISHQEIIKITDIDKQVIVIKLKDIIEHIKELKHITEWQGDMLKKFGYELRYFQKQKGNILYEKKIKKYRDEIIQLKKQIEKLKH